MPVAPPPPVPPTTGATQFDALPDSVGGPENVLPANISGSMAAILAFSWMCEATQEIAYAGLSQTIEMLSKQGTSLAELYQGQTSTVINNMQANGGSSNAIAIYTQQANWLSAQASAANQTTNGSSSALQSVLQSLLSGVQQDIQAISAGPIAIAQKIAAVV